ncbi:MAG TPA: hypothetical protein VIH90_04370 [Candidatus Saccharimonadales bacterium]
MPKLQLVTTMRNKTPVYVNLLDSHASTHIKNHPELLDYARTFLKNQEFHEPEIAVQHNVGQTVGLCDVVETTNADDIIYAKRINRVAYTRFVKNREPVLTNLITMVLRKNTKDGAYELWSIWIGPKVPPFPGDDRESPASLTFWDSHALVWGN